MKSVRSFVFWLHVAAGCTAGIVILVMSVTGILLAFERNMECFSVAVYRYHGSHHVVPVGFQLAV